MDQLLLIADDDKTETSLSKIEIRMFGLLYVKQRGIDVVPPRIVW